ncbi:MAG: DUF3592 domain-containing protein [Saprospiraceae bacterium]|nr:DUF3592 domain-containing protein [Saprospiraceae bacterium]
MKLNLFSAVVFSLLIASGNCLAGPDFSTSTITPRTQTPLTSSIVLYDLVLRNTGDGGGMPMFLQLDWGGAGFLAGIEGLDSAQVDHDAGMLTHYLDLPAGTERRATLQLFTFNEAKGDALSVRMRLVDFSHTGSEYWEHPTITLEQRPYSGGVSAGSVFVTNAGLMVLLWLGLSLLAWMVFKALMNRRSASGADATRRAAALTFLWMMPIGFWCFFGAMAWKDIQICSKWVETQGTIIGRHMDVSTTSARYQSTRSQQNNTAYSIALALKFEYQGKTMYGSGYDPDSFLEFGGRKQREKEIREWTVGAQIPCWINPEDPTELVVKRGFGGAYLFALLPLPFFIGGVRLLRKRLGDRTQG